MKLSNTDLKLFSKQIVLKKVGVSGQKKLLKSKVLIVGMGGLGCPLLLYLVSSGVGEIGIADHDKIELSNLNRQILYNFSDIGKLKVEVAKNRVNKINPKIKINTFSKKITKDNISKIIKNYDIICDGSDNFETRFIINDHSKKMKKNLISAAISKFEGQLFNFNFKLKTPCYRCFMPKSPTTDQNCEDDGIISPVAGILGSLQANEVIKTILDTKQIKSGNILVINGMLSKFRNIKLMINPKCVNRCKD